MKFGIDYLDTVLNIDRANLVRAYHLRDLSGDAQDLSINNEAGNVTSATQAGAAMKDGSPCYVFDGVNDHIEVSTNLNTDWGGVPNIGTIMVWFRITDEDVWEDDTYRWLFEFRGDSDNLLRMRKRKTGGKIETSIEATADLVSHDIVVDDELWHCIIMRWDLLAGTKMYESFLDGVEYDNEKVTNTWDAGEPLSSCEIGAWQNGASGFTEGNLAMIMAWKSYLSDTQIGIVSNPG